MSNKFAVIFASIYAIATLAFFGLYLNTGYSFISVLFGGFLAALPVPLWILLSLLIDKKDPEPKWMLSMAFIWGSSIAVAFALIINSISSNLLPDNFISIVIAPISEEIGKGSLLLLFYFFIRRQINGVRDGIIYAIIIGLGFSMTENMVYYAKAFDNSFSEGMNVFFIRGLFTPYLHPIFTSLTGIGVGLAVNKIEDKYIIYKGLLGAIGAHAIWNGLAILLSRG